MAEKLITMIAVHRVGHGGGKVALPGAEFDITEGEAGRLEKAGAAKRKPAPPVPATQPKAPKEPKGKEPQDDGATKEPKGE